MAHSQELRDALFIPTDNRANFKQVIAKRSDLVTFAAGRMKPAASGIVSYEAGLVLGYASSGADAGFYKPYASGNTDGSQVAVGVLAQGVSTDASGNGSEAAIIKAGCLFADLLIGLDGTALVGLKASQFVEHGTNLINVNA